MANVMTQTAAETVAAAGAEMLAAELRRITNRYHEGRIDYASYGAANARVWRRAESRGIVCRVARVLRETTV